jgi:uncharacterized caspase-like protein
MNKKAFLFVLVSLLLSITCLVYAAERNRTVSVVPKSGSENKIALVIGNGAYTNSPLKNPVNDAKDMATKLRGLGFNVIERYNLQTKQIGGTLREFRSKLSPGAVALVFYAGHGLQINGENYLPAVDADINSEDDVPNQSLAVRQIMVVLDESKSRLNLVFLDACRNNPYARSFRSSDRGLARVSAPSGTLISYATKPGSVAADGNGRNGLYTSKLLAQMDSNQEIEKTLKRVVTEVKAASQGKQEPWMEGSIEGDFCFAGCAESSQTTVAEPVSTQVSEESKKLQVEREGLRKEREELEQAKALMAEKESLEEERQKLEKEKQKLAMAPRPKVERTERFSLEGGVIDDSKLGLQWAPANGQSMNHYEAEKYAQNLSLAGGGWRLPTRAELKSLYDTSKPGNADLVFNINNNLVWTSELVGSSSAWYFYFNDGNDDREGHSGRAFPYSFGRVLVVRSRR